MVESRTGLSLSFFSRSTKVRGFTFLARICARVKSPRSSTSRTCSRMKATFSSLHSAPKVSTATSCMISAASCALPRSSAMRASMRVRRARSTSTKICARSVGRRQRRKCASATCAPAERTQGLRALPADTVMSVLMSATLVSRSGVASRNVMHSCTMAVMACGRDGNTRTLSTLAFNFLGLTRGRVRAAARSRACFSCERRFDTSSTFSLSAAHALAWKQARTMATTASFVPVASAACRARVQRSAPRTIWRRARANQRTKRRDFSTFSSASIASARWPCGQGTTTRRC